MTQSATETISPRYGGLDTWPDAAILSALWEAQMAAVASVGPALGEIARACEAAVPRLRGGGRLCHAGAGTSARIAVQDAAELPPTFGWPADRLASLIAGGPAAMVASIEGAEDDEGAARDRVAELALGADDVLLGIAASGATPYTVAAVQAARARGALTIAVAGVADSPLTRAAAHAIVVATGAEPIAGSTRLKAGTAQKVVLNAISTLLMIRLGHVHDGLMVDMQPGNAKLRARARKMVRRIAGCEAAEAEAALSLVGGNVKRAVLIARGLGAAEAEALLARHAGSLRAALGAVGA